VTKRVHGDCSYCGRPALPEGVCANCKDLLAGEPDAVIEALQRLADADLGPVPPSPIDQEDTPEDRRRLRS
jgi:hypothetical protein